MSCKKKLIVDDDEDILNTLSEALQAEAYDVLQASNGVEAFRILEAQPENDLPGMIILDLQMPVMDGGTFLKNLVNKPYEKYSKIPVIISSAKGSLGDVDQLFPLTAGKIRKPMDLDELYELVEKYCRKTPNE